ncbi:hypothetical protein [Halostagnicola sp. A56]|uniref:hypothetical protein n=1 Tax=Halostagnicola sp. A56 TaxID=1495067 RepID=UPI00049FA279|nr:hypothetical protein [Halostagnicola sp. A56]
MAAHYHDDEIAEAIIEFERNLESLVLEAFASGVPIEQQWVFVSEPSSVPDWTVRIERRSTANDAED